MTDADAAPPRALDVPGVAGLVATVLVGGALASGRVGEALEWRLYLLLGTVVPAILVAWGLAVRRWPQRTGWTHAVQGFLVVAALAAVAWRVDRAFDPRAALVAAICTGAAAFSAGRRSDLAAPIDWKRQFVDPIVFFAVILAACHGFLGIVWWPTDPDPIGPALLRVLWLAALTLAMCLLVDRVPKERPRLDRALLAAGAVVIVAASLRIPNFHRQDDRTWHHWGAIASPAEMVRDGGALLWDVPSQYGFLSTLSLAWWPVGNSWEALRSVQALALAASALLLLGLLFTVRRGVAGFAVALGLALASVFLVPGDGEGPWGPFTVPSMGSFRFVWVYAMLAVALWESRRPGRASWLVGTLVYVLGCLWSVESAAYCTATWIPALAWSRWSQAKPGGRPAAAAKALALPVASLAGVALAIDAAYRAFLGVDPDLAGYYEYAASFVQIYAALPIEPAGPFVGVVALFCTVSASLARAFARDAVDAQVVSLASFGAAWSTTSYFVSSSRAETADSVMPVWLAAIALLWWTSEQTASPWRLPMARWLVAAWSACLLYAATYEPRRLEPFVRDLVTDPLKRLTPELPRVGGGLAKLLREAGASSEDRVVLVYPNAMEVYDPAPGEHDGDDLVPNRVWLPLAPLLRPLTEERQQVYVDRLVARGVDRGWYVRLKDQPFLGRGYLWKYHLGVEARTVATQAFEDDKWIVEWREPLQGAP